MEFRTLLILGLCACVAIAAPSDDVPAEEESDRGKLEHIIRVLDSVEDQFTEDELDYLDGMLEGDNCPAAEDEHHRQKRACGCDIPCCNALDECTCTRTPPPLSSCSSQCRRGNCDITCPPGQLAKCKCTGWLGRGKCKCT